MKVTVLDPKTDVMKGRAKSGVACAFCKSDCTIHSSAPGLIKCMVCGLRSKL